MGCYRHLTRDDVEEIAAHPVSLGAMGADSETRLP